MSLYAQLQAAMDQRDADKWIEHIHEDFQFVRHQSNTTMNREQIHGMMKQMMASEAVARHNPRCIYENDQVLVDHVVIEVMGKSLWLKERCGDVASRTIWKKVIRTC